LLAGGFFALFFVLMTMLSLQVGNEARIALAGIESAAAICFFLAGWVLVFDKDIKAWRNQARLGRLEQAP